MRGKKEKKKLVLGNYETLHHCPFEPKPLLFMISYSGMKMKGK